jgi:hypothetical protein
MEIRQIPALEQIFVKNYSRYNMDVEKKKVQNELSTGKNHIGVFKYLATLFPTELIYDFHQYQDTLVVSYKLPQAEYDKYSKTIDLIRKITEFEVNLLRNESYDHILTVEVDLCQLEASLK